ncbi:hypothetical protein F5Y17DRAFT_444520 [Xylariaceae sp. FL0594]|nr:hypothetical protein F5Y17DRAFT_444520 [Xylariaceae sp. FL0594]
MQTLFDPLRTVTTSDGHQWLHLPTGTPQNHAFYRALAINNEEARMAQAPNHDILMTAMPCPSLTSCAASYGGRICIALCWLRPEVLSPPPAIDAPISVIPKVVTVLRAHANYAYRCRAFSRMPVLRARDGAAASSLSRRRVGLDRSLRKRAGLHPLFPPDHTRTCPGLTGLEPVPNPFSEPGQLLRRLCQGVEQQMLLLRQGTQRGLPGWLSSGKLVSCLLPVRR